MRKILPLMLLILLSFSSCIKKNPADFYEVNKKLTTMRSYSAKADVTIYGNKGVSRYVVNQFWMEPNKLRIETMDPDFLKGKILIYDGAKWKIQHPQISQSYEIETLNGDDQLIYIGIVQKSILSGEDAVYKNVNRDGNQYIEVRGTLPGGNEYRRSVALFMKGKEYYPEILEIYDDKGDVRVKIVYTDFKYNAALKDSLFKID